MLPFVAYKVLHEYSNPSDRKTVLMTGFPTFPGHDTNPSWEGVNFMNTKEIENKHHITLHKEPVPVDYLTVDLTVRELLDIRRPDLTILVGLSPKVSSFVLETRAKRDGYKRVDLDNRQAAQQRNACQGLEFIRTSLDAAAIRDDFNRYYSPGGELHAEISDDAGGFLCEYIYYTALCHRKSPTLFVHVPHTKYSSAQLARGLEHILILCLKHLVKANDKSIEM